MVFLVVTASATIFASVMLVDIMFCFKVFQTIKPPKRSMMYLWKDLQVFSSSAKDASLAITMLSELCSFEPYWMFKNRWN
jgi:hypothetical protein